jgi:hypothetical protein
MLVARMYVAMPEAQLGRKPARSSFREKARNLSSIVGFFSHLAAMFRVRRALRLCVIFFLPSSRHGTGNSATASPSFRGSDAP